MWCFGAYPKLSASISYFVIPTSYFLVAPQRCRDPQRAKEHDRDDRISRYVVPSLYRGDVLGCRDPDEKKSAPEIRDNRDRECPKNKEDSPNRRQPFQLPKKQSDHERGLERAHSAAGFVYPDQSGAHPDEIAFQLRRNSEQGNRFRSDSRNRAHQPLDDRLFDRCDPRDRDKNEADWKGKVPDPGPAAREPDDEQGDCDHCPRMTPGQCPPIRIRDLKQPHRK